MRGISPKCCRRRWHLKRDTQIQHFKRRRCRWNRHGHHTLLPSWPCLFLDRVQFFWDRTHRKWHAAAPCRSAKKCGDVPHQHQTQTRWRFWRWDGGQYAPDQKRKWPMRVWLRAITHVCTAHRFKWGTLRWSALTMWHILIMATPLR